MFIQQQIDHLIQVNAGGDGWDAGRWEIQLKHYQKCNAIITCKFKQYYAKTFLATYRIQGTIWGRFFEWSATKVQTLSQWFFSKIILSIIPEFGGYACPNFECQNFLKFSSFRKDQSFGSSFRYLSMEISSFFRVIWPPCISVCGFGSTPKRTSPWNIEIFVMGKNF